MTLLSHCAAVKDSLISRDKKRKLIGAVMTAPCIP